MELDAKIIETKKGVAYWSSPDPSFEKTYLEIRRKEQRLYSDEVVNALPDISKEHPHYKQWLMRQQSFERIKNMFSTTPTNGPIMDLGCGNGWFTFHLSQWVDEEIYGIDVNQAELEQASRVFKATNLKFVYADIFDVFIPPYTFSFIILNSSVQYFHPLNQLLDKLCNLLRPGGEIHILDSPFYSKKEVKEAKLRSQRYFKKMHTESMAAYYHHHTWEALSSFPHEVIYPKSRFFESIKTKVGLNRNPFPWIRIKPSN